MLGLRVSIEWNELVGHEFCECQNRSQNNGGHIAYQKVGVIDIGDARGCGGIHMDCMVER